MNTTNLRFPLFLLLLGMLCWLPFLGSVHLFDWDEINFAESAREMLLTKQYNIVQIGFKAFWEKPPLFFWLQSLSMSLFGVNEWAARLPNALFGSISLLSLYYIGRYWHNEQVGRWWALLYIGSFLPHLYFKSGIIDPIFNYFIFISVFFLSKVIVPFPHKTKQTNTWQDLVWSGTMAGLAVLTKGPVALLLIGLTVASLAMVTCYHSYRQQTLPKQPIKPILLLRQLFFWFVPMLLVASIWVVSEVWQHGTNVLWQFIIYQIRLFSTSDAGHQQALYYHWVVVFVGCFPLSVLALPACFAPTRSDSTARHLRWLMLALLLVVLIVFTIVKTKIVHYSSLAYLPLAYLAAIATTDMLNKQQNIKRYLPMMIAAIGSLFACLLMAVPLVGINKTYLIPYIKDPFAVGNLSVPVAWHWADCGIGLAYMSCIWIVAFYFRTKTLAMLRLLVAATIITLFVFTTTIVPKIEAHSQGSLIDFCQSKAGQKVYVETVGFKSYAKYFYFRLPPNHLPEHYSDEWLLTGNIDKDAYLITKVHRKNLVTDSCPNAIWLEDKGGFAFFMRPQTASPTPN